jgi:hypothetical protein
MHGRPPRESSRHSVPVVVPGDLPGKAVREERALRPRTDDRHLSTQDVDELWQFVQRQCSQEAADPTDPIVVDDRPSGV